MKLDLLGGSYESKYLSNNSQKTINWFANISAKDNKEDDKDQLSFQVFPGLLSWKTLPGRYFRGFYVAKTHVYNRCFAVVDNVLYEVFNNASYTSMGTMSNLNIGSSKVYMVVNANNQLGVFSNSAGYYLDLSTNVLTQITSSSFLGSVDTATYLDGYTVITSIGTVQYSSSSALQTWNSLNTFSPTSTAAKTMATVSFKEQLYNFTEISIETYLNDGTTPWSRLPRSTMLIGLKAKESLIRFDQGFIFVGQSDEGDLGVYYFDGYSACVPISPTSITSRWRSIKDELSASYATLEYSRTGQIFYRLTVPALRTTFVYDLTTKLWVEQQSKQPYQGAAGEDVYREFRGRHHVNFKGLHLWGDLYSGKIFIEDETVFTEDSNTIIRTRISQTYCEEYKNIPVHSLELDCSTGMGTTTGVTPTIMMQLSKDGGYHFSDPRPINLGALGDHTFRARVHKLGTARNWTVKLVYSDPGDIMIQSAIVHGTVSVN